MASNPDDIFAEFRTGPAQAEPTKAPVLAPKADPKTQDIFSEFRVDQSAPNIPREDNSLGEEFRAGLGAGIDSMQGSLYGVAGLMGRELGIDWMKEAGYKGAQEQFEEAGNATRQAQGFSEIESAGGFFRWTAASLGEAIPSLATAMTGAGVGASVGKKAVELGVKRSLANSVERRLVGRYGFDRAEAMASAREYMLSDTGQTALARALGGERTGALISKASQLAGVRGGQAGAVAVSALPQVGAIDQELVGAGIADPGLTALLGGVVGGALEAVPALRLMDKMFPGVDRQVSKSFIKDFAVATGTQAALEGSTEAAQEMIQLAAMAYHDPSFDMFSADARKRVVDAFAAGALVGAVTGGGAEAIGAVNSQENRNKVKAAPPKFKAWVMETNEKLNDKAETALPEGFVAADNTVYQEIKGRIYGAVAPQIEGMVNGLQAQVQKVTDSLNENLEGGVNADTATIAQTAKAAHNAFLEKHGKQIEAAKTYMNNQIENITRTAKDIKDPEARAAYIEKNVQATRAKLAGWMEKLRQAAAKRDKDFQAEVDNMEFPDDMFDEFNFGREDVIEEEERRVGPSGRTFKRRVGPAPEEGDLQGTTGPNVGETDSATVTTWGRNQLNPKTDVSGKETVVPYKTKADAEKGRSNLRKKFPETSRQEDAFRIVQHESGKGWVIEAMDPTIREGQKFFSGIDAARSSAARTKNNTRNNTRKFTVPLDGSKFGYKFKNLTVDLLTLAYRGKNIDKNADTLEKGFHAMLGEMLAREMVNPTQAKEMVDQFNEHFGDTKKIKLDEFAAPTNFPTEGVAKANMINFINKMKERGIKMPYNMINTVQNEDGTYSFGIDDVRTFRALRTKSPQDAQTVLTELKKERRQEQLADAAREEGEFSGNAVLEGGGDLGDTRGDTAGAARIATDPIRTGRTGEGKRTATRTKTGGQGPVLFDGATSGQSAATTLDTDPQADDQVTDPKTKPSEFDARFKANDPALGKVDRQKRNNAEKLSDRDKAILKRYGRPGGVKNLLNGPTAKALGELATFVRKTLGLSNQVIILDEAGMQTLLDAGHVQGAAFEQAIARGKPANIRLGDNSFIYLPNKIASDPALATLAMGHEMGHHLYTVAWDNLTDSGKERLRKASKTKTDAEFNEWMADQLAAWITTRRAPKTKVEAFFAEVGGKIRRLVDFITGNKRFQLNPTYAEFADAVAARAKDPASPNANPLSDAELATWFKNEGVTMYKWFGQSLENDNMDFSPVTAEGRRALARVEQKFPAIVKRAMAIRNWMNSAYKLLVAPSTSVVRSISKRGITAADQLIQIFNRQDHGKARGQQNYHQAVELMRGQFLAQYKKLEGLSVERKAEIAKSLAAKEGDPNAEFDADEQAMRDMFDALHAYAIEAGLPVRKITNYFPRQMSRELLTANKQRILDHLTNTRSMPLGKARSLYNSLIDPNANDGRATTDATETPGFKAMNSRKEGIMADKFFDQFRETNMDGLVGNYINQVVKRAEFNRRLGEPMPVTGLDAKEAVKKGLWDPKGKMHKILADAKDQGATDEELVSLEKYIDANLGQLGRDDIKPGVRKLMAGIMAYQNMRTLLFTVFASLPDMVGPAIRGGGMKAQFNTLKREIHNIAKTDSDLAIMAKTLGIISDAHNEHIMTEYVDNHYMPPKLRKWNDAFFKWTGLNYYTDFTRKMALAVGIDYIKQSYVDFQSADSRVSARGKDMLAELGLTPQQVARWQRAGQPTYDSQSHQSTSDTRAVAEALVQFVDESIMRPNASQRPIMASHPGAMLVYHLKGYMYAVHDIVLKRMKFNIDEAQSPAQYAAAISPAIAMMLLTAVGLELRELIQYAGSNRQPPTDRMDGWEYTFELMQRSGLTGFAQIAIDLEGAEDRGMSHVAGIGGPTLSQLGDWMSKPSTQTIPKAIPIVSQIPALRDTVRRGL